MLDSKIYLKPKIFILALILFFIAIILISTSFSKTILVISFIMFLIFLSLITFGCQDNKLIRELLYSLFISLWISITIYVSIFSVRFGIFMAVSFAFAFAFAFGKLNDFIIESISKKNYVGKLSITAILFCLFLIPIFIPSQDLSKSGIFVQTMKLSNQLSPYYNDEWNNLLTNIRDNTSNNTIINSWWDYGHWLFLWHKEVQL
jgi:hypothetical protein